MTDTTDQQAVTVAQIDVDARQRFYDECRAGMEDDDLALLDRYFARHRLASVSSASAEGFVLVPREPTEAMLIAMRDSADDFMSQSGPYPRSRAVYAAMLTASPEPVPATNQAGEVELEICHNCDGSGAGVADTTCSLCNGSGGVERLRAEARRQRAKHDISYKEGSPWKHLRYCAEVLDEIADEIELAKSPRFVCAAATQGTAGGNDPASCDYPECGCAALATQPATSQEREALRQAFLQTMQPLFFIETAEKLADKFMSKVSL